MDLSSVLVILASVNLAIGIFILMRMRWPLETSPEKASIETIDQVVDYFRGLKPATVELELQTLMIKLGFHSLSAVSSVLPQEKVDAIVQVYAGTGSGRNTLMASFVRPLTEALEAPEKPVNQNTLRRILRASETVQEQAGESFRFPEQVGELLDRAGRALKEADPSPADP